METFFSVWKTLFCVLSSSRGAKDRVKLLSKVEIFLLLLSCGDTSDEAFVSGDSEKKKKYLPELT